MRRLAAAVAAVVAVTGLVGLAGAPAGAADDPGPCDLLSRAAITKAFGQKASRPTDELGPVFCQWTLAATPEHAPGQVNVVLESGKDATRDYRIGLQLAGSLAEPVDGLGKKAFYTADTGTLFVLTADGQLFYVQANVYDGDANRLTDGLKDTLTGLARRAEARL